MIPELDTDPNRETPNEGAKVDRPLLKQRFTAAVPEKNARSFR